MNLLDQIGPDMSGLDVLRDLVNASSSLGFAETLGLRLAEIKDGFAVFEGVPDERSFNAVGSVHGGFAASMLDYASGYAVLSKMKQGQSFATLQLSVSYQKAIRKGSGKMRAEGRIISLGRKVAFTEAHLYDPSGKLCASASSTLLIVSAHTGEGEK